MRTKRFTRMLIPGLAMLAILAVWLGAQSSPASQSRPLAEIVPANALVYLEAKNLAALLADWNASPEKKTWLASGSYQSFLRSKLALRLEEAQKAYAASVGVNPNAALLENLAGGSTAVAVYDIGKLEFLYVTRLPAARLADNLLQQARAKLQVRNAGGQPYYVKSTADGTIAFATAPGDLLIAATREDLVATSLQLLAARNATAPAGLHAERWFRDAIAKADSAGAPDLRLAVHLERVSRTPHFRTYWIQQNITDLRQYTASVSDFDLSRAAAWTERRTLLRAEPSQPVDAAPLRTLAAHLPDDVPFQQAWANPTRPQAEALLEEVLVPRATGRSRTNPEAERSPEYETLANPGSEEDLESRIDAPVESAPANTTAAPIPIRRLAALAELDAIGQAAQTRGTPGGVFVAVDRAAILQAKANWDENAVRTAVQASAAQLWSARPLSWTRRGALWELSGLQPVAVWINGRTLVIANSSALATRIAATAAGQAPAALSGSYIAAYRHAAENANYARIMQRIDFPSIPAGATRAPMLFSDNIGGIGNVLGGLDRLTIEVRDEGAAVRQQLVYRRRL